MSAFITVPFASKVKLRPVIDSSLSQTSSGSGSLPPSLSGNGSITGIVLENGAPVSRSVMLYERNTGAFAGKGKSKSDGSYTFNRTNENLTYFVIAIDDNEDATQYNLVGQDLIAGDHDQRTQT